MSQEINIKIRVEKIISGTRGFVFNIPTNKEVVFLMSGGIDSSVGAELIIKNWGVKLFPLYIMRGASASIYEYEAVKNVVSYLSLKYPKNVSAPLFTINLNIPPIEIKSNLSLERIVKKGHPLRNSILQSVAVQYAVSLNDMGKNINTVFVGSVSSDYFSGSRLVDLRVNTLYICCNLDEWGWQIASPMLEKGLIVGKDQLTKKDLVKWGYENSFPFGMTRTCTTKNQCPCGGCEECKERIKTFKELDVVDPISYVL